MNKVEQFYDLLEDDYLESIHDMVYELKQDIERAYLDDYQNRIDNPQDYE